MTQPADFLLTGAGELLTLDPSLGEGPLGLIRGGALAALSRKIVWVGKTARAHKAVWLLKEGSEVDARGRVVLPGFVDSHTHAVFSGSREREFAQRIAGATYQEIAAAGGGILSTVNATRDATADELVALAGRRLDLALQHGTTTLEVKSGYGLTTADEIKMLEAIRVLQDSHPVELHATFCGAHEVPPEFKGNADGYVDLVVDEMLPAVAEKKLAEYCDVFCEEGVFSVEQARRILLAGVRYGLRAKFHADEFTPTGGAELAAEVVALSADHLLHARLDGIRAMQEAGVTATLLPGTAFFLGLPYAPARAFLETGVRVALATDFNPGSSYTPNMQLILTLACTQMRLTVEEAVEAATLNGAYAMGLQGRIGSLTADKQCDLIVLDLPSYYHLPYLFGVNHVQTVVKGGQVVWSRE
ncbi:MAG: imidazolonepropionase [Candidatus Rokubacteria bacterium]|nr:imidazolonepropionase [Candidatus Rokubacteria bacterium]